MKKVLRIDSQPGRHWVGDGFPVRTLFSYNNGGAALSPFLMLDYAAPMAFDPTTGRRGVGEHPHRGFETVTIVYQGELEHRDSTGSGGLIGPGDVQWMTAGGGILHEEFHSEAFSKQGGNMEMVQLWVNLPAKDKMAAPGYQTLLKRDIPVIDLPDDGGSLRVIAGAFGESAGPARTFSPINVWDIGLKPNKPVTLEVPDGHTTGLVVLRGTVRINGDQAAREAQWISFDRKGTEVRLEVEGDAKVLLLSGAPLDEPIAGYGPFVMNTQLEISEAIDDFNSGRFGRMVPQVA
ncbi:pirin family protein [Polycyclovorans algicola]|uniref:pirin family protein n=1 Tax=Polycyclovorans algicola TaxID=616992 RepID=UPI0004A76E59|nr:pirin family protein [Polycyclovorans algicola]